MQNLTNQSSPINNFSENLCLEMQILLGLRENDAIDFFAKKVKQNDNLLSSISLFIKSEELVLEKPKSNNFNIEKFAYKPPQLKYIEYTKTFTEEINLKEKAEQTLFSKAFFDEECEKVEENKENISNTEAYNVILNPTIYFLIIDKFEVGNKVTSDKYLKTELKHIQPQKNIKIMKNNFGKNHGNDNKNKKNDTRKNNKLTSYYDETTPNPQENQNLITTQGKNMYVKFDPFTEPNANNINKSKSNNLNDNNKQDQDNFNNNQNKKNNFNNNKNNMKHNNKKGNGGKDDQNYNDYEGNGENYYDGGNNQDYYDGSGVGFTKHSYSNNLNNNYGSKKQGGYYSKKKKY